LNKEEVLFGCDTVRTAIKVKGHKVWNVMQGGVSKVPHNDIAESLFPCIARNTRLACVVTTNRNMKCHVLGVFGNYCILNTHNLCGKREGKILISLSGVLNDEKECDVNPFTENDFLDLGNDITLMYLKSGRNRFSDITMHMIDRMPPMVGSGMMLHKPIKFTHCNDVLRVAAKDVEVMLTSYLQYEFDHEFGMCGNPIVCNLPDKKSALFGIHSAGYMGKNLAYGSVIDKQAILDGLTALRAKSVLLPINSEGLIKVDLEEPNAKSAFRYEHLPFIHYIGKEKGDVQLPKKSRMVKTPYAGKLDKFFEKHLQFKRTEEYGQPMFRPETINGVYVSPYNEVLKKMNKIGPVIPERILTRVIDETVNKIVKCFHDNGVYKITPKTFEDSVNGVNHNDFVGRINCSTSAGYGYAGIKGQYLPIVEEEPDKITREMVGQLKKEITEAIDTYKRDECVNFVFKQQLKDEPRLKEKCKNGGTRSFYMAPLSGLIMSKMFLSPLYSLFVEFGECIGTAVGIDIHTEANDLVEEMENFSEFGIEGDYKCFDINGPIDVSRAASTVIYKVFERMGYNGYALKMVKGLLSDAVFPVIIMLLDLFLKAGMQPSGNDGTAELNSLKNRLMAMINFYSHEELWTENFDDCVKLKTYGDDFWAAIKKWVLEIFNAQVFQADCKKNFDMDFTTPDKKEEMEKFMPTNQITFLKRSFVYKKDKQRYEGLIDRNSIYKSLEWIIPSKVITNEEQMLSMVVSNLWELYFWSEDERHFMSMREDLFKMLVEDCGFDMILVNETLPCYSEIHYRIYPRIIMEGDDDERFHYLQNLVWSFESELNEINAKLEEDYKENVSLYQLQNCQYHYSNRTTLDDKKEYILLCAKKADIQSTLSSLKRKMQKRYNIVAESEDVEMSLGAVEMKLMDTHENVADMSGGIVEHEEIGSTSYMNIGLDSYLSIDDFFKRPIEVANMEWTVGSGFSVVLAIWNLFTLDPGVRAKLRNYSYFKADLIVRVVISGTPFHFGKLLASYQVYPGRNDNLTNIASLMATFSPDPIRVKRAYLSQSNGAAVIDVKSGKALEMKCPFISTKNAHRLYNSSNAILSAVTSYDDLADCGSLYLESLDNLATAAPSNTAISVQVYVWAENVHLGCLTATQVEVASQSKDEFISGPVQRVATTMAYGMKMLSYIPAIRPLAKASEMVFKGISGVASWFGWSRPIITTEPHFVKNEPFRNGSHMIGSETAKKISADPRQELTIDPRILGTNLDEMTISSLCKIESYITTFTWSFSNTRMGTPIFICRVHPQLDAFFHEAGAGSTNYWFLPSPMSYVASIFNYWNGTIKFRLDIVCSAYHRGKLLIGFEPNIAQEALIVADINLNKNFMSIVDIQETQSISFCVNWAQARAWLQTLPAGGSAYNYGSAFSVTSYSYEYVNGFFFVVPFTELTSPNDSDVSVHVFVSSDDIVFQEPTSVNFPSNRKIVAEGEDINDVPVTCITLNETTIDRSAISVHHFGEQILSLRALLHRYCTTQTLTTGAGGNGQMTFTYTGNNIPAPFPAYATSSTVTVSLMQYLRYAFVAVRGGVKKRFHLFCYNTGAKTSTNVFGPMNRITVTLGPLIAPGSGSVAWSNLSNAMILRGSVAFSPSTNGGIEYEVPYFSSNLFDFSFNANGVGTNAVNDMAATWSSQHSVAVETNDCSQDTNTVVVENSAGDDFMFIKFNGSPFYKVVALP